MTHIDDINDRVLAGLAQEAEDEAGSGWKLGLPPGEYYPGMENDFDVRYAPLAPSGIAAKLNPKRTSPCPPPNSPPPWNP